MCTTNNKNRKTTYLIKITTLFLGLFFNSNYLESQCSGSFYKVDGENFGSGVTMFTSALPPGITTYTYKGAGQYSGCIGNVNFTYISDSFYTIGKNPANCLPANCSSSFTSNWINAGDHTTGTGYMMIVNARGIPDIFYNKIYSVVPNSTITFSLWAANICKLSSGCIEPRIKILFRDPTTNIVLDSINSPLFSTFSNSTLNWIKLSKSFIVPAGLSNVKLEIRNMQVGNNGNDIAIDDIEFSICMPTITILDKVINVCETKNFSINPTIPNNNLNDITYLWQYTIDTNGVWTSLTSDTNKLFLKNNVSNLNTGFYRLLIAERGNIDSPYYRAYSIPIRVNVLDTNMRYIYDTICSNGLRIFNGQSIATTGIYRDTLVNAQGCDSFLFLNLYVKPTSIGVINASICSNATYFFNGQSLSTAGSYKDTLKNSQGCDSFLTLNLTIKNTFSKSIYDTICSNGVRIFNGQSIATTGIYRDTLVNAQGCDSFLFLNLYVKLKTNDTINASICSNTTYFFNGESITTTGIYRDTLVNAQGCDSFLILNLTIKNTSSKSIYDTICSNRVRIFNGDTITTSGIYLDTLVNSQGCDSFLFLNLYIKPKVSSTLNVSLCSNETYDICGKPTNIAGTYIETFADSCGCYSYVTINLTVKPQITTNIDTTIFMGQGFIFKGQMIYTTGTYIDTLKNYFGCDSIIYYSVLVQNTVKNENSEENDNFIIPNYISPNGDNNNDFWVLPQNIYKKYPNLKSIIYNRWGNIVWRSSGKYNNNWSGQLEGSQDLVPDGVYFYLLDLEENMEVTKVGFIEVKK